MMKYATAIRLGTASTEAILRRFNSDVAHPAYAAMLEVGRAQRTIFIARYLHDRDLQREINAGLNVVENYNGVNDYIFFGKSGELSSNRREEQEISMSCLQILQSCLGYINTLMIQDTLAEPEWADRLSDADRRGLTPLFTMNMTPYGDIQLNLDRRLNLGAGGASGRRCRCAAQEVRQGGELAAVFRPCLCSAETPQMAADGSSLTDRPYTAARSARFEHGARQAANRCPAWRSAARSGPAGPRSIGQALQWSTWGGRCCGYGGREGSGGWCGARRRRPPSAGA